MKESNCDKDLSTVCHFRTTLENTIGIYMVLLIGLGASFIVFTAELLAKKVNFQCTTGK